MNDPSFPQYVPAAQNESAEQNVATKQNEAIEQNEPVEASPPQLSCRSDVDSDEAMRNIASIRQQNLASLQRARFGISPDSALLESALNLGDVSLIAECRLCRACAKSGSSRPAIAKEYVDLVTIELDRGLVLEPLWAWRYENTCAIVTAAFSQSDRSWQHHEESLKIATEMGSGELIGISEINLSHDLVRTGMTTEAFFRLTRALTNSGLADATAAGIHLILAHLSDRERDEERSQTHRVSAERFALQADPLQYSKLLILMTDLALRFDDRAASLRHVEEFRTMSKESGSPMAMLDYGVFRARLHQLFGEPDKALTCVQKVLDQCGDGWTVQTSARVLAGQLQVELADYDSALATVSHESLRSAGAFYELEILKIKRLALEGLGRWEEAAGLSGPIRIMTRDRAVDLQTVFERQVSFGENADIRSQTHSLQLATEALRDLASDNEEIVSMISNNLQSPLTALQLIVGVLRDAPTSSDIRRHVALAHRSILRISSVVQQLVLAGELEAGMVSPERERVELAALLQSVDSAQRSRPDDRSMSVVQPFEAGAHYVDVDSMRFEQLLDAVISGVVRFSPAQSKVELVVTPGADGCVEFRVEAERISVSEGTVRQLRSKRPQRSATGEPADVYSDLSFYLAEELGLAMQTPLQVSNYGDAGLAFSVVVSGV